MKTRPVNCPKCGHNVFDYVEVKDFDLVAYILDKNLPVSVICPVCFHLVELSSGNPPKPDFTAVLAGVDERKPLPSGPGRRKITKPKKPDIADIIGDGTEDDGDCAGFAIHCPD